MHKLLVGNVETGQCIDFTGADATHTRGLTRSCGVGNQANIGCGEVEGVGLRTQNVIVAGRVKWQLVTGARVVDLDTNAGYLVVTVMPSTVASVPACWPLNLMEAFFRVEPLQFSSEIENGVAPAVATAPTVLGKSAIRTWPISTAFLTLSLLMVHALSLIVPVNST